MNGQDCEQLTLFPADSPASPFLSPGSDEARRTTVTSGRKCCALSRSSGPLGSLVRTLLASSAWRSTRCLLTWKVSATPARRSLYRLVPSMPRTGGTGVRLWPTPTAQDAKNSTLPPSQRCRGSLPGEILRLWTTPKANAGTGASKSPNRQGAPDLQAVCGGTLNPTWVEWLMGFPIGWTDLDA